jgi:hypothetical protein
MAMLLHLARWLAWQMGDHGRAPAHPPAHITVFSAGGVEDL